MHSDAVDRAASRCAEPIGDSLDGIAEIAEQVPSVGDLDDARRTLTNAVSINAGSIARNDLDARLIAQPSGNRCGVAVWEEIDHLG